MDVRSMLLSRVGYVVSAFFLFLAISPTLASAQTKEESAKKLISTFNELCQAKPGEASCVAMDLSCKAGTPTCELVQASVCFGMSGDACAPEYLCTSEATQLLCAGGPSKDGEYVSPSLDFTLLDEDIGDWALSFRIGSRTKFGNGKIGMVYQTDTELGLYRGGGDSGFVYDLQQMIGGAARLGERGMYGVVAGGGISGMANGHIGFGIPISFEAFFVSPITSSLDLEVFLRPSWVYSETSREGGSDILSFADELTAQVGLSWVDATQSPGVSSSDGYKLLLFFKERLGTQMLGLGIGWSSITVGE